jgi:tRNA(Met) C34 N-acetyltransferase TmcA
MVNCRWRFNAHFISDTSSLHSFLIISGQSNAKIEELLQEDHNAKRRREKFQKQSSLLSKLTRQLSIHDNRAAVSSYSNDSPEAGMFLFAFF